MIKCSYFNTDSFLVRWYIKIVGYLMQKSFFQKNSFDAI